METINKADGISTENLSEQLQTEDDQTKTATRQNPLGQILLEIAARHNDLCKKLGETHVIDGQQLCKNFTTSTANQVEELEKRVADSRRQITEEIVKNELEYTMDHKTIAPPSHFGPEDNPNTQVRLQEACKIFPVKRKYDCGTKSIIEFLAEINSCQDILKLSRSEFSAIFRKCFSKEPFNVVNALFGLNYTIEEVYHSLISQFDNSLTPEEARIKLHEFKANRKQRLIHIINQIIVWATRCAAEISDGEGRVALCNLEARNALTRALPAASSQIVSNTANVLAAKLRRAPLFIK